MVKHWKYMLYLLRHKWFVLVAGLNVKAPLWRLIIHNWSKCLPSEWFPYARYFYGSYPHWDRAKIECPGYSGPTKESVEKDFDVAWLRHLHRNPHHWQHWVLREDSGEVKTLRIPAGFVREMVADWAGAGRAITGQWEVQEWYEANKHKMTLHKETRYLVELLLTVPHGNHPPS